MKSMKEVFYIIEMTEEEAREFKVYCQNPMPGDSDKIKEMKEQFFNHLDMQGLE